MEADLGFLPVGRRQLSVPAAEIPLEVISSPELLELYEDVLDFAQGRTAPKGATRPMRLVGVSANQLGIDRAFVYVNLTSEGEWTNELRLMVDPRIVRVWGEDEPVAWWHGCFSTGCLITVQELPRYMEVEYYDADGQLHSWTIDGVVDGARQLHVVWHEIEHTRGKRHVDHAVENGAPIFIVLTSERKAFNQRFLDGRRDWHRILPAEGWREILASREWRYLIVYGKKAA